MSNAQKSARLVLITIAVDEWWQQRLQQISPELQVVVHPARQPQDISNDVWQQVEILYASSKMLPTLEQAPRLRWVHLHSAGVDSAIKQPLFQTRVIFTTNSGVHAINAGEYVFMMLLAWYHRFPQLQEWRRQARWPSSGQRHKDFVPQELHGKTIGIIGYGSIGRQVAHLAQSFGMHILALQRSSDHRDHGFIFPGVGDVQGTLPERFYVPEQLHTMLAESDIVVICVPLTEQTRGLFDEAAFKAMKPTAFLVNIARGEVCDEATLLHALQDRQLAGAALDVFNQEPLPPDSPFWHLPNVFMSPHITGETPHYTERAMMLFTENVRRYLTSEPLYNTVNKERGY
jgi:phosphoglycerate dehydrogenase-like enzyme